MEQGKLFEYMQGCPWKEQVILLDTVESTNVTAQQLAAQGAPHGTVVLAEHQTAGRGRLGRTFSSPKAMGIYCSVVLRFAAAAEELFYITPLAAEAVRQAVVETTGLAPQIKWINDLLLDGRKLCGILTQLQPVRDGETVVVLGIGLNCSQQTQDFPESLQETAISLEQKLGRPVEREKIAGAILRQLWKLLETGDWLDGYRTHCVTIGADVQLLQGDTCREAHVDGMDDHGALWVTLTDGSTQRVFSGEVSVRGLYGYV